VSCIYQINLQNQFGGGEVYTRFFTLALIALGHKVILLISHEAKFWGELIPDEVQCVRVGNQAEILQCLPSAGSLIVTQTVLDVPVAKQVASTHVLCGFVHMPLYERNPPGLAYYHLLFPVSRHVQSSMRDRNNIYTEPLYAVADPRRGQTQAIIRNRSEYNWDLRKMRDRVLGSVEPLWRTVAQAPIFTKRPGLTLGIVSRLTPIKQFPQMFKIISPIIARFPKVNLEIFGSGGYASVRDLRASLAPISSQARFWGHQPNAASVYPLLDFVLSGLPEKEALGPNVIEAQFSGTPVIAVKAPPFIETVLDGSTGYLYADPREDGGNSFAQLLERILTQGSRPDPREATEHLEKFSFNAFRLRVSAALFAAGFEK